MPTTETETLVEDLLQTTGLLIRRLRAEGDPGGLTWSQSVVVGRLGRHGPATTAALARAERVKPQSMGMTLAALEREGLVTRQSDPEDGRQWIYALTAQGQAARERHRALKRGWLTGALSGLEDSEKEALGQALAVLRRLSSQ